MSRSTASGALRTPLTPMLAAAVDVLPVGPGLAYEPKWDGWRALAFRDGDDVRLQSRVGRDLTRRAWRRCRRLGARGATRIRPPGCPGCRRTVALVEYRDGARVCRTCAYPTTAKKSE